MRHGVIRKLVFLLSVTGHETYPNEEDKSFGVFRNTIRSDIGPWVLPVGGHDVRCATAACNMFYPNPFSFVEPPFPLHS